jgi:hypothetical protein
MSRRQRARAEEPFDESEDDREEDDDEEEQEPEQEEEEEDGGENVVLSSFTEESGLAALNDYRPGPQSSDSKCYRYYGSLRLWLNRYAKAKGVAPAVAATWVRRKDGGEPSDVVIMPEEPIAFLDYLEKNPKASCGIYEMALRSMQWWLGLQCEQFNAGSPKGYISNTAGTRERTKRVKNTKHKTRRQNMTDMQADVDETITRSTWIKIAVFCMSFIHAPGYFEPAPLMFVLAFFALIYSHVLAARGEDIRGMSIGCLKTVLYPTIGQRGMLCLANVSGRGKTNRSGRHVRQGCLPDINPILCSWNALGLSLFYRWNVALEAPPDWGDGPDAYVTLFTTPLLRSPLDPAKPMSYSAHNDLIS